MNEFQRIQDLFPMQRGWPPLPWIPEGEYISEGKLSFTDFCIEIYEGEMPKALSAVRNATGRERVPISAMPGLWILPRTS